MNLKHMTFNRWLVVASTLYVVGFGFIYGYFQSQSHSQSAAPKPASKVEAPSSSGTLPEVVIVPFLTNVPLRATITRPANDTTVQSDKGWVTVEGKITAAKPGERFFIMVESSIRQPPVIYLQRELHPTVEGSWSTQVKYGSIGHTYQTYIIASQDAATIQHLKAAPSFTDLPSGFEVVSAIATYTVQ